MAEKNSVKTDFPDISFGASMSLQKCSSAVFVTRAVSTRKIQCSVRINMAEEQESKNSKNAESRSDPKAGIPPSPSAGHLGTLRPSESPRWFCGGLGAASLNTELFLFGRQP